MQWLPLHAQAGTDASIDASYMLHIPLLDNATHVTCDRQLMLRAQVPGLAEARPSVMRGDALYVVPSTDPEGREWQGYVHMVRQEEVSPFLLEAGSPGNAAHIIVVWRVVSKLDLMS